MSYSSEHIKFDHGWRVKGLFTQIGLEPCYPQKLTLHDALAIREDTLRASKCTVDKTLHDQNWHPSWCTCTVWQPNCTYMYMYVVSVWQTYKLYVVCSRVCWSYGIHVHVHLCVLYTPSPYLHPIANPSIVLCSPMVILDTTLLW